MYKGLKFVVAAATALTMMLPGTSQAFGPSGLGRDLGRVNRAYIPTASRIAAPFAGIVFCNQNPEECRASHSRLYSKAVFLNEMRLTELKDVNASVNRRIIPANDAGDTWSLEPASGDCEDYAITKRHELIARGWPSQALRLAVAYTGSGEGHMVLVVKTNKGDLVLDNRFGAIREWNKTGLRWVMIQSPANPARWLQVASNVS